MTTLQLAGLSPKDALEKRAQLIAEARQLNEDRADSWGEDDEAQYDRIMSDAGKLQAHATRVSQLEQAEAGLRTIPTGDPAETPAPTAAKRDAIRRTILVRGGKPGAYIEMPADTQRSSEEYEGSFENFLISGVAKAGLHEALDNQSGAGSPTMALQSDSAEQAGYLLASEQFAAGILKEMDDLLWIRQRARIHTVREASSLGIRARKARMSTFNWSQELQVSTSDSALKYGKRVLTPHHATGAIEVSRDLLRRAAGVVNSEITFEMARDAGELMEDGFLTGHGSQQPLGVFTASSDGISTSRDSSSGSATSITADALLNAKYSLKAGYRSMGPRWLFHRDAIKIIAKLKDSDGQYLFRVGAGRQQDNGLPEDVLLNYGVDESERAPNTFTTGLYVGLLAVWRYYEIADALDMEVQRLVELKAGQNQVQFIGRMKTDGMPTLEEAFVRLKTD